MYNEIAYVCKNCGIEIGYTEIREGEVFVFDFDVEDKLRFYNDYIDFINHLSRSFCLCSNCEYNILPLFSNIQIPESSDKKQLGLYYKQVKNDLIKKLKPFEMFKHNNHNYIKRPNLGTNKVIILVGPNDYQD